MDGSVGNSLLWPLEIEVLLQFFYSKGWCIFLQYKLGILASQNLKLPKPKTPGRLERLNKIMIDETGDEAMDAVFEGMGPMTSLLFVEHVLFERPHRPVFF